MKSHLKSSLVLMAGVAFSLAGLAASAESTTAPEATKKSEFAAKEKAMQDASRSSATGAVASPTTPTAGLNRNKDAGKGAFEGEMMLQKNKPSRPVDKNAPPADPIKSISKMTPAERAALRKEVVEGAKP